MHVGDNADVSRISKTGTCAASRRTNQDDNQGYILSEMLNARNRILLILKMPSETDRGKKRIPVQEYCCFVDTLKWTYISERLLQDVNRHMKNINNNVSLHLDKHNRIILRTEHLNEAEAELFARQLIWDILIKFSTTLIYVAVDESDTKLDSFPPHFVQVYDKGKLFIVCDRGHACQLTHILGQRVVTVQLQFPKALRKLNVKCIDDLPCEGSDQTFLNCLMSGTIADVLPKIESVVPHYVRECTFHDFIREQFSNLNIAGELDGILNDANLTCVSEFANKKAYVFGFEEENVLKACELVQRNIIRCEKTLPPSYDNSQCAKVMSEHKMKSGGKYELYMRGNVIVAIGLANAIAIGFDGGKDKPARASASFTETACGKTSQSQPPEPLEGYSDNPVTEEDTTGKDGDCVDAVPLSTTSTRTRSSTKQKTDNIRMWEIKSKTLILNMNRVDKIDTDYVLTRPQASERDVLKRTSAASIFSTPTFGNLKKPFDDALTQRMMGTYTRRMESVGAIMAYLHAFGTGFRVGSNYIMTALHVITGILDPSKTGRLQEQKLQDISISFSDPPLVSNVLEYKFKCISYVNKDLDIAILEISNHNQRLPVKLSLRKEEIPYLEHLSLIGFGHPKNPGKHFENRCAIIYPQNQFLSSALAFVQQHRQDIINHLDVNFVGRMQSKGINPEAVVDLGYESYNADYKLLIHCFMEQGASGSPILACTNPAEGAVEVVGVLTHCLPEFFFCLSDMGKCCIPKELRFEAGSRMTFIFQKLCSENQNLAQDIFS